MAKIYGIHICNSQRTNRNIFKMGTPKFPFSASICRNEMRLIIGTTGHLRLPHHLLIIYLTYQVGSGYSEISATIRPLMAGVITVMANGHWLYSIHTAGTRKFVYQTQMPLLLKLTTTEKGPNTLQADKWSLGKDRTPWT